MPEGPEVRITTEYLNDELAGCELLSTKIMGGRYFSMDGNIRKPPKGWETLENLLPGTIDWVDCKGKTIFFKISNSKNPNDLVYLKCGLGMTGRWNKMAVIDRFYQNKKHPHRAVEFTYRIPGKSSAKAPKIVYNKRKASENEAPPTKKEKLDKKGLVKVENILNGEAVNQDKEVENLSKRVRKVRVAAKNAKAKMQKTEPKLEEPEIKKEIIEKPIEKIEEDPKKSPETKPKKSPKGKFAIKDIDIENWHTEMDSIAENQEKIWFCDPRRFGSIEVLDYEEYLKALDQLGPDMLANEIFQANLLVQKQEKLENKNITVLKSEKLLPQRPIEISPPTNFNDFFNIVSHKKHEQKTLTKFLMDQKNISGVGNYIKAEALYEAKISPYRKIIDIEKEKLEICYKSIVRIMNTSYALQGNTLKSYYSPTGEVGSFFELLKVYGKDQDPEGNKVRTDTTDDGRTTHWVQKIQV